MLLESTIRMRFCVEKRDTNRVILVETICIKSHTQLIKYPINDTVHLALKRKMDSMMLFVGENVDESRFAALKNIVQRETQVVDRVDPKRQRHVVH